MAGFRAVDLARDSPPPDGTGVAVTCGGAGVSMRRDSGMWAIENTLRVRLAERLAQMVVASPA